MSNAPATGKLKRGAISGLALARAGITQLGHQARQLTRDDEDKPAAQDQHEAELGRILFRALNQLKGTALKVSQLLSMEADFLPQGIRSELAKGCYQVTPLNRALVHKVFSSEFGQAPEQLFAQFEANSFAAASLGQVHHASLADGTLLAVKVQYPGIAASVKSDIRMLRGILQTLGLGSNLIPRQELIDRMMNEIEHKLVEELDYQHEAAQLRWFRQHVSLPGIVIPRAISSHSSRRVLSMQRLDGLHLEPWLATGPSQAQRDHFGQLLYDWFWTSVRQLGRLHADPHPGNFLFMADGQLGVLDFGCTKTISAAFCAAMAQAWSALLAHGEADSYAAVRDAYLALGVISPELSLADFETELMPAITPLIDWQLEPYRTTHFDFSQKTPYPSPDRSQNKTMMLLAAGFHQDLPYFDRAYLGLMHMLKKIGANVATGNPWTHQSFDTALTSTTNSVREIL
ncbi:ABC1 kinase family protein [Undibacterium sp. Ren11W]|uniref:ABC1 kinase family protein n=1 Tax=Undibacterium sp. Ren11W TaxID=3413045 RepID=UPI003BF34C32